MISLKRMLPESARRWVKETNPLARFCHGRRRIPSWPAFIFIELTSRCNLSCRMCCHDSIANTEIRDMPFELVQQVVDQAQAFPGVAFHLYGIGEPLLYPRLPDAIEHVRDRQPGARIVLDTNAHLLTGELADRVLSVDEVLISLNAGSAESYRWLTGSDAYEKVVANIEAFLAFRRESRRFRETRKPFVYLQFLETIKTQGEESAFRERWEPLLGDASTVNTRRLTNWGGAVDTSAMEARPRGNGHRHPCVYLWRSLAVDVRGNVYPCCEALGRRESSSLCLGNTAQGSIQQVYFSERLARARRHHLSDRYSELADCRACDIYACHRNIWCRLPVALLGRRWV